MPAVAIGPTTVPLLVTGSVPVQLSLPEPPDAVQDVALAAFQVSVIEPPGASNVGLALNVMAGGAGGAEVCHRQILAGGAGSARARASQGVRILASGRDGAGIQPRRILSRRACRSSRRSRCRP